MFFRLQRSSRPSPPDANPSSRAVSHPHRAGWRSNAIQAPKTVFVSTISSCIARMSSSRPPQARRHAECDITPRGGRKLAILFAATQLVARRAPAAQQLGRSGSRRACLWTGHPRPSGSRRVGLASQLHLAPPAQGRSDTANPISQISACLSRANWPAQRNFCTSIFSVQTNGKHTLASPLSRYTTLVCNFIRYLSKISAYSTVLPRSDVQYCIHDAVPYPLSTCIPYCTLARSTVSSPTVSKKHPPPLIPSSPPPRPVSVRSVASPRVICTDHLTSSRCSPRVRQRSPSRTPTRTVSPCRSRAHRESPCPLWHRCSRRPSPLAFALRSLFRASSRPEQRKLPSSRACSKPVFVARRRRPFRPPPAPLRVQLAVNNSMIFMPFDCASRHNASCFRRTRFRTRHSPNRIAGHTLAPLEFARSRPLIKHPAILQQTVLFSPAGHALLFSPAILSSTSTALQQLSPAALPCLRPLGN